MKAIRIALLFWLTASTVALGQSPAEKLSEQGNNEFNRQEYDKAALTYTKVLKDYPTYMLRDSVRLQLGLAYLFNQKYQESIEALTPLVQDAAGRNKDAVAQAQYYLPLSQFFAGAQPNVPEDKRDEFLKNAAEGFTKYIDGNGENKQEALFYRGIAYYILAEWSKAQSDLQKMVNNYRNSPSYPEYLYRLGLAYDGEARDLLSKEETAAQASPKVEKAVETFSLVTPEMSEIVSNQAQFAKANIIFVHANIMKEKDKLPEVLEEYRKVRSRNEMLPVLNKAISDLEQEYREAARRGDKRAMSEIAERRARLVNRKEALEEGQDPALQAYLQMGQSFRQMGKFNEARMLFRRIEPFSEDKLKKQVMMEVILSLALQGKSKEADEGFNRYIKAYPGDDAVSTLSLSIGNAMLDDAKFDAAIEQFDRILEDPQSKLAVQAALGKATALNKSGRGDEAAGVLEELSKSKAGTVIGAQADFQIGEAFLEKQQFDKAVEAYKKVLDNPEGTGFREAALIKMGTAYMSAGQNQEAADTFKQFLKEFPNSTNAPTAMYYTGLSLFRLGKVEEAVKTLQDLAAKYPDDKLAPFSLYYIAKDIYGPKNPDQMVPAYEALFTKFPKAPQVVAGRGELGQYYRGKKEYEKAKEQFLAITKDGDPVKSAYALILLGDMMYQAAVSMGNYPVFTDAEKQQFQDFLKQSEKAFQDIGIQYPETQYLSTAVNGLYNIAKLRHRFKIIDDAGVQRFFEEQAALMKDENASTQVELINAAWPYEQGDFADSLALYEAILKAKPNARLGRDDTRRYGDLLLREGKLDEAIALFKDLESRSSPRDVNSMAVVNYGLGMAYLKKKDYAQAKQYLAKFQDPAYARFQDKDMALIGLARILAQEGDTTEAKKILGGIANSRVNSGLIKSYALIALAGVLEKEGAKIPDPKAKDKLNAAACYGRVDLLIGLSHKELAKRALLEQLRLLKENNGDPNEIRLIERKLDRDFKDVEAAPLP